MPSTQISYRDGYKFQLADPYVVLTDIHPPTLVSNEFISLHPSGSLCVLQGYAWDGATGTLNTSDILRGSLVHDSLYQLMREGFIDPSIWRDRADRELQACCIEDGMPYLFAELVYQAVHLIGERFAQPGAERMILHAPMISNNQNDKMTMIDHQLAAYKGLPMIVIIHEPTDGSSNNNYTPAKDRGESVGTDHRSTHRTNKFSRSSKP